MSKIYQNFEDVGVAGTVLYCYDFSDVMTSSSPDRPRGINGEKVGIGTGPAFGLYYDPEYTKPVHERDLKKLVIQGCAVVTAGDEKYVNTHITLTQFIPNIAECDYESGRVPTSGAAAVYIYYDTSANADKSTYSTFFAFPDPVVED